MLDSCWETWESNAKLSTCDELNLWEMDYLIYLTILCSNSYPFLDWNTHVQVLKWHSASFYDARISYRVSVFNLAWSCFKQGYMTNSKTTKAVSLHLEQLRYSQSRVTSSKSRILHLKHKPANLISGTEYRKSGIVEIWHIKSCTFIFQQSLLFFWNYLIEVLELVFRLD